MIRRTLRSRGVCKACLKLLFFIPSLKATVEAVKELIKKHEAFEKRMNTNDDKINQMMQFAERLNDENHYASDKITEKARSIDERQGTKSSSLPKDYRRIFLYIICHISISDTVSDEATKTLVLNIERTQHD